MNSDDASLGRGLRRSVVLVATLTIFFGSDGRTRLSQAAVAHPGSGVTLANLHFGFEQNIGQTDRHVRYLARAAGYTLFLTQSGAVLSMSQPARRSNQHDTRPQAGRASSLRIRFDGADSAARITGVDPLPGRVNYFVGRDQHRWRTDVPTYDRVKYSAVYPGIDLIFRTSGSVLECDFVVAPGANPDAIRLSLEGGDARIDKAGDLSLRAGDAELTLKKPATYQEGPRGEREPVQGRYVLSSSPKHRGATLGVVLGSYDRSKPLVIDPQLVYSTYLGGSSFSQANGIAVDSKGFVYVTGATKSADFPLTSGAFQTAAGLTFGTSEEIYEVAFVTILNPAASGSAQLVYSTFLGGSEVFGVSIGNGIAVGPNGNVYVAGQTDRTDFPVTAGAFQMTGGSPGSAFVSVLNPAASGADQLVYSSFLGDGDAAYAIAVDSKGLAYLTGSAVPDASFPVTSNAFSTNNKTVQGSPGTAFVSIIDPSATGNDSLVYSTFLGGSVFDSGSGIAVGPGGVVYLSGTTSSPDFPVTGTAFKPKFTSGALTNSGAVTNAFVTVLNPALSGAAQLAYSTYLGGSRPSGPRDESSAIAVDSEGLAYVTGNATSSDFPLTKGALQTANSSQAVFVSKLDPSKSGRASLDFSTFLGGPLGSQGLGIAVDSRGFAYITGSTASPDFPVTKGALETIAPPEFSAFISVINPGVNGKPAALVYSTFLGSQAFGVAIAVDSNGVAYIAGSTDSPNFPVTPGALLPASKQGGQSFGDAFASVVDPAQALKAASAALSASPRTVRFPDQFFGGSGQTSAPEAVVFSYPGSSARQSSPIGIQGIEVQDADPSVSPEFQIVASTTTCAPGLSLTPGSNCTITMTFTPRKVGARSGTLTVADNASNAPQKITLQGKGVLGSFEVTPSQLDFGGVPLNEVKHETPQFITLTNNNPGPIVLTGFVNSDPRHFRIDKASSTCLFQRRAPANGSCQFGLIFQPSATGKLTASLKITAVASNSPQTVKLIGVGLAATATPMPGPTPIPK